MGANGALAVVAADAFVREDWRFDAHVLQHGSDVAEPALHPHPPFLRHLPQVLPRDPLARRLQHQIRHLPGVHRVAQLRSRHAPALRPLAPVLPERVHEHLLAHGPVPQVLRQFISSVRYHVAVARVERTPGGQLLGHLLETLRVLAQVLECCGVAVEDAIAREHGPFFLQGEHDVVGGVARGVQRADRGALAPKDGPVGDGRVASGPRRVVHVTAGVVVGANGALAVVAADAFVREDRRFDAHVLQHGSDVAEPAGVISVMMRQEDPFQPGDPFVLHGLS